MSKDIDLLVGAATKAARAVVAFGMAAGLISWTVETAGAFYLAFEAVIGLPALIWLTARRRRVS